MTGIGQTVSHYTILEKIGEGGMGVVYKARDLTLDRIVALKFLPSHIGVSEEANKRFIHEARSAASLIHPGICSVFDILDHNGEQIIVMEFLEGKSLRTVLAEGRMNIRETLDAAIQIADALAEAHRGGIVHRDVKPENVIIGPSGRAKVLDFGLARKSGRTQITREGAVVGTTAYMSPEQAQGEAVDVRTDIWAFGVLLYEASTGKLPFASDYDQAVVYGILNENPSSPRSLNAALPESLERIIRRCMEKLPDKRYQRMDECLADLKAVNTGAGSPPSTHNEKLRSAYRPVAIVLGIGLLVVLSFLLWPHPGKSDQRSSIAVLPFKNLNDKGEDAYFAEGLTEDIISQLGTVRGLKVIGRSSVMRFKNTDRPFQEVAAELGASTLLEGSVRHVEGRIRVVARLVDYLSGEDLWNETYDRNLQDILAIQSEIASRISAALRLHILSDSSATHRATSNLQAWRLYQQGRTEWYKRSSQGVRSAISYFQQAIAIDSNFAIAHAGLSDALALLGDNGIMEIHPAEAFREARQEALKALSLDDNLADAHHALGHLQMHQFEWEEAERSFLRSADLDPNSATTQALMGLYYSAVGDTAQAFQRIQNCVLVDPLSIYTTSTAAAVYVRLGRADSAAALMHRMLRIEPTSPRLHFILGLTYSAMHQPDAAVKELQLARASENTTEARAVLAQAYAFAGRTHEARALVDSLINNRTKEFVEPIRVANAYVALGRNEDALHWLEVAVREESAGIIFLKTDPWLAELHAEPRFTAILKTIGLAP